MVRQRAAHGFTRMGEHTLARAACKGAPDLEVYRRVPEGWLLVGTHEGDAGVSAEPFEAVEIALALLWVEAPADGPRAGR